MTDGMVAPSTFLQTIPLQRMGGIDDIGGLVLFLASKVSDCSVHKGLLTNCPVGWGLHRWGCTSLGWREANIVTFDYVTD